MNRVCHAVALLLRHEPPLASQPPLGVASDRSSDVNPHTAQTAQGSIAQSAVTAEHPPAALPLALRHARVAPANNGQQPSPAAWPKPVLPLPGPKFPRSWVGSWVLWEQGVGSSNLPIPTRGTPNQGSNMGHSLVCTDLACARVARSPEVLRSPYPIRPRRPQALRAGWCSRQCSRRCRRTQAQQRCVVCRPQTGSEEESFGSHGPVRWNGGLTGRHLTVPALTVRRRSRPTTRTECRWWRTSSCSCGCCVTGGSTRSAVRSESGDRWPTPCPVAAADRRPGRDIPVTECSAQAVVQDDGHALGPKTVPDRRAAERQGRKVDCNGRRTRTRAIGRENHTSIRVVVRAALHPRLPHFD